MYNMFNIALAGNGITMISKKENVAELAKMVNFFAKLCGSSKMKQRVADATNVISHNI